MSDPDDQTQTPADPGARPNPWVGAAPTPSLPSVDRLAAITAFDILRFAGGGVVLTLLASLGAGLILGPDVAALRDFEHGEPGAQLLFLGGFYLALIALVLAAVKWARPSVWRPLRMDSAPLRWLILGPVLILMTSAILSLTVSHVLQDWLDAKGELQVEQFVRNGIASPLLAVATFLAAGVIGPIAEEMIFRGLLLGWLQRLMPFWLAALISSALFGAVHIEPLHILLAAPLGLVFAYLYRVSGSLWPPIAAHMANNIVAVIAAIAGL